MSISTLQQTLTWATGGPYPHEYKRRVAGNFGCDPCWHCRQSPAGGEPVWMNCYGDLYCDPCAQKLAAAWLAQRHAFERPPFGDTYCARCGATRDGVQHSEHQGR